jgi:hypothetical protein
MYDRDDFAMMVTHSLSSMTVKGCSFMGFQPGTLSIIEILLATHKYECSTSQSLSLSFHPQR